MHVTRTPMIADTGEFGMRPLINVLRSCGARVVLRAGYLAAAFTALTPPAVAQVDPPTVITPLRVEPDPNGVNLDSGKTIVALPTLSVPAAPRLTFERVQEAAPYVSITFGQGDPDTAWKSYSVHVGDSSESFNCGPDGQCQSVTGSGSQIGPNGRIYRQAGTYATYNFSLTHLSRTATNPSALYYASSATYPDGEVVSYSYDTATDPGDYLSRTYYRPVTITSSRGYFISVTYQSNTFGVNAWGTPAQATLYKSSDPTVPLAQLTYSANGTTVTDLGGRTFEVQGASNTLGAPLEAASGSTKLPTENTPATQVTPVPGTSVVGSITRDGVTWTYAYTNLSFQATYGGVYWYDKITVTGPNGYHVVYDVARNDRRNIISKSTDSIGRSTSYEYDLSYRPTRIVFPEGNEVRVTYDSYGNLTQKTMIAKPGSGLSNLVESAYVDTTTCAGVLCYRPVWSRDALGRQTDYAYDSRGLLTERTDPADASGVRRKTYVQYDSLGRAAIVRVCGDTTTCGTSAEIRTEFEYWGDTSLPLLERRIDASIPETHETRYTYDAAGRVVSVDGPLPGTDDTQYYRYDVYGRKVWEIGALAPNGLRLAKRYSYRDSDDKVVSVETGTIPSATSTALTVLTRTDTSYDTRRHSVRQTLSAFGTVQNVLDRSFDDRGQLICETIRMYPASFAALPSDACIPRSLNPTAAPGPDRITRNIYDAAGQLLTVQKAYGTSQQQNYATFTYSANGRATSFIDAKGNKSSMVYDGFDRQIRWYMPSSTTAGAINSGDYEEYGYDAVGNRTSLRKRDGSTIVYTYDALNRVTSKIVPTRVGLTAAQTRDVYYGYDVAGLQLYARFDSGAGEGVTNVYDGFGRLTSTTSTMGGVSRTLSFKYDFAGNRTRITHPDNVYFAYDYDALNRMSAAQWKTPTGSIVPFLALSYEPGGRRSLVAKRSSASGYTYAGTRLSQQTQQFPTGTVNATTNFTYNPAGQVISRALDNNEYQFTNNVEDTRSYSTNGLNQYSAVKTSTYAYDLNGNLTGDGSKTYTYDVENRLVGVSGGVALTYDPLGRLWEVVAPSGTTRFLYDGNRRVAEYSSAGAMLRRYAYASGGDEPALWDEGSALDCSATRFLHTDERGSIVATSNCSGARVAVTAYDAYGVPNATTPLTEVGRFRFTGQAYLPEVGMYYFKARIYSPMLGRFMQTDPIGYADQANLYVYVGNDPVNLTDPTGLAGIANTCSRVGGTACSGNYYVSQSSLPADIRVGRGRITFNIPGGGGSYRLVIFGPSKDWQRCTPCEGVDILFAYTGPDKGVTWIQSVSVDNGQPYADLNPSKPEMPFYFSKADRPAVTRGNDSYFVDRPGRPIGADVTWRAQTSAVVPNGAGGYRVLATFEWGWTARGGVTTLHPFRQVQPDAFQQHLIGIARP